MRVVGSAQAKVSQAIDDLAARISRHEDFVATFESPQGKRVLRYLIKQAHVLDPTFVQGDAHATSFKEGQRHIVLTILRAINKDTNKLIEQIENAAQHES